LKYLLSLFIISSLFIGCSYKPSSYYAKPAIVGKVYVDLDVDIKNAQNSVYVKDATNEMILNQFNNTLTDKKEEADTLVSVLLSNVNHKSLSTDDDGYTKSYRTSVTIKMTYQQIGEDKKRLTVSDYYDYQVDTDSVVTDQKKKLAVKEASTRALSKLFSKIAVYNMKD